MKERNNLVANICDVVCKKCKYGNAVEKLNEHEKVFFVTQTLDEVAPSLHQSKKLSKRKPRKP